MALELSRPGDAAGLLASAPLLETLESEAAESLLERIDWLLLKGGDTLFSSGDPSDGVYLVLSGKLVVISEGRGLGHILRRVGTGQIIGELAVLTGKPRSATVRAVRDSELIRLPGDVLERLLEENPGSLLHLAKGVAGALRDRSEGTDAETGVSSVAVVPGTPNAPTSELTSMLANELSRFGSTHRIDAAAVEKALGVGRRETPDITRFGGLTRWLDEQEAAHRFVLYQADSEPPEWTEQCMRQADRILVVAWSDEAPSLRESLRDSLDQVECPIDLVLIHKKRRQPSRTERWRSAIRFTRHHHATLGSPGDIARLARHLAGRSVGVVLGGGGARAYAHIGVLQALIEAGIPIDRIGGASMGAVIACMHARGFDSTSMVRFNREEWVDRRPLRDFTLPMVALSSGRGADRAIRRAFGDVRIEDLWIPCFCVSANLTSTELRVHRTGLVAEACRASLALPGILPPVTSDDGTLLVDGGVLNNLPTDIMRADAEGPVIAVDVSPRVESVEHFRYSRTPSPWQLLVARAKGRASPFPSVMKILQRSATLASTRRTASLRGEVDLLLTPPVRHLDSFGWGDLEPIVDAGYRYAQAELARLPEGALAR